MLCRITICDASADLFLRHVQKKRIFRLLQMEIRNRMSLLKCVCVFAFKGRERKIPEKTLFD